MMGSRSFGLAVWGWSILCSAWFSNGYFPPDNYLIDCGSSTNTTVDDRVFLADSLASEFLSTPQDVLASTSSSLNSSVGYQLYQTARVFTGNTTYKFPISQGHRHWVRLYFSPFSYNSYQMSTANFAVSAQNFVLLSNFSTSSTVMKEFSLSTTTSTLAITITPSSNSFAFLNALEVVSVPDRLFQDDASILPSGKYQGLLSQALETVWRVNMGGPRVSSMNDTLWRTWEADYGYLVDPNMATTVSNVGAVKYVSGGPTQDTAPASVYGTTTAMNSAYTTRSKFNVTWEFDVDVGYRHLIRFHFCDIVSLFLNQLHFNVFLDSSIVVSDLDLSSLTFNVLGSPYFMDLVTAESVSTKLRLSVGPSTGRDVHPNAILNGLEIMKLNNSEGSLSGAATAISSSSSSGKNVGFIVGITAEMFLAAVLAGILFVLCQRRRRLAKQGLSKRPRTTLGVATNCRYHFPFAAIQEATNHFDEGWVVGIGGFGKVYRAELNDGTKVAVKRSNPLSRQGLMEFRTEIAMLSQFRHRHLVSLIGYCHEENEMILIYEYMENGTLKSHLYGSGLPSLSWKQRLEICIGAARGLHYLHTGHAKEIIHRDVKSANNLLDENLMAKVADFGLSRTGPEIDQTHVSTKVRGTFGYLDPEYYRRLQLTVKSDVYSFGVVLLEVLCARPVIDTSRPWEEVSLAEWAMKRQKQGQLDQIVDPALSGEIRRDSLRKFGETAEKCLAGSGADRPPMGDVLRNLEHTLRLQEAVIEGDPEENSTSMTGETKQSPSLGANNFSNANTTVSTT